MSREIRRIATRTADGWRDVIVELGKIPQPCRTQPDTGTSRPPERLVEHGRELTGRLHGRPVRLVLRVAADGTRLWELP